MITNGNHHFTRCAEEIWTDTERPSQWIGGLPLLNTDYILGMAKTGGKVKILLDIDKVLSGTELAAVSVAASEGLFFDQAAPTNKCKERIV
jgi:hypothetical protein